VRGAVGPSNSGSRSIPAGPNGPPDRTRAGVERIETSAPGTHR